MMAEEKYAQGQEVASTRGAQPAASVRSGKSSRVSGRRSPRLPRAKNATRVRGHQELTPAAAHPAWTSQKRSGGLWL